MISLKVKKIIVRYSYLRPLFMNNDNNLGIKDANFPISVAKICIQFITISVAKICIQFITISIDKYFIYALHINTDLYIYKYLHKIMYTLQLRSHYYFFKIKVQNEGLSQACFEILNSYIVMIIIFQNGNFFVCISMSQQYRK